MASCAICLEPMSDGAAVTHTDCLPSSHVFHERCLLMARLEQARSNSVETCPVCRSQLLGEELRAALRAMDESERPLAQMSEDAKAIVTDFRENTITEQDAIFLAEVALITKYGIVDPNALSRLMTSRSDYIHNRLAVLRGQPVHPTSLMGMLMRMNQ